ncbi:ThuA domain-containing protein [Tunicatimonas pelagia]|uniref:ThuA domain-containing protein n=1 Tax=Tunicatimonas pelagia TaxID=931531 RepID=UPI002666E60A|nr:ThuA domain-containing protein [Tunicatimonas pelagia]WKN45836.1 ThuA domain-containing protein [Tunicatimonas pelagia]
MKRALKIVGISLAGLVLVAVIGMSLFIYKARYGFNFYETTPPELPTDLTEDAILIFSKTNGYRHSDAIEASLPAFRQIVRQNGWSIFTTDNGAVFNPEQLAKFKVVVWNNTSGKVLNEEQRQAFRVYLEDGGGFVGIHAAGDNSHQWEWYEQEVIGADFSHHPLNPQMQQSMLYLEPDAANHAVAKDLPGRWEREEEWYIFSTNPRERDADVLYTLDESLINPSGNFGFLVTDKGWGMGDDHPIVWYRTVGKGRVFYSALGHQAAAFEEPFHLTMLENAIRWTGKLP